MSDAREVGPTLPRERRVGGYARWMIRLRWFVVTFWALATAASVLVLPPLSAARNADLQGFLPTDTPAVRTEIHSVEIFGFPLLGRTVLVQRDPAGLSAADQAQTVARAARVARGEYDDLGPLRGALPVINTFGAFPGSTERDTTALTYLFYGRDTSFSGQLHSARNYADRFFETDEDVVGVTGSVPARLAQARLIRESLPTVELATLAAIILIVGVSFRSVVAPLVALVTTAVAFTLTLRLAGYVARLLGVAAPDELEPLVVVLLLGIVTDYVVFFTSALRHELAEGAGRHEAARAATMRFAPIVAAAGLAVAAGTATLVVADSVFFAAMGPGLAFTVLMGLLVAVTLVPALMALLGRAMFWPTHHRLKPASVGVLGAESVTGRAGASTRWLPTKRRTAAVTVGACGTVLLLAALPLQRLDLGVSFVASLPGGNGVREAAAAAQSGFAPGILSPSVLLVENVDVDGARSELARMGELLDQVPGVAGVLAPGNQPRQLEVGTLLSPRAGAARFLIVLEDPALGAQAIDTLELIRNRVPALLTDSGLEGATAALAGDTAVAAFTVQQTQSDLLRIAMAALLANLLMLVLFLRALLAPLYLLAVTVLSVAASLGLTTYVFTELLPGDGLTFYVPFAAAVLLLALGSDYNIFAVGHVWELARHRPLHEAMAESMPRTTRAITVAGITLAVSFAMLALVPLRSFRELAFAMFVGILLDIFVVRSLLMPALLTLVGPASAWPSRRLHHPTTPAHPRSES